MSNTPSDAEIEKLAAEHLKAFSQFPMGGQVWFEGEVEFARAALARWGTQPQAGAVPQGWKAVPVNPTPEMWKAAKTVPDPNPPYPPHYGLVWDAMLAASPTPPVEQAAPKAAPGELSADSLRHQNKLLAETLGACILASGIVRKDIDGFTGPELLHFGEDLRSMLEAAPQPAPAPLNDDVVKDAARWRMAALIGNEVMLHPDKRTHATAVKAYMDATHSGSDLTGAVDAALAAQGDTP